MHNRHNADNASFPPGVMSIDEINRLIDEQFPQIHVGGRVFVIGAVGHRAARMHMIAHDKNLRPGNTLSGPSMFQLADLALYVAILATLGAGATQAVTTNLNINFLSRPSLADLIAEVDLVKVGRKLVIGEVEMYSADNDGMVAHAIATYALPPVRDAGSTSSDR
jgi:uncharacterized protein (TIGR00369 family)